jgi:AcrR family transcriptional regulator
MDIVEKKPGTKRPAIVRARTLLFAEKGIDAASMREIAQAAGARESAIYCHFAGKDDLAREILRVGMAGTAGTFSKSSADRTGIGCPTRC